MPADTPVRLALKLMNARFDDAFQLEMLGAAGSADALVVFNRLWDPAAGVAFGGYDLSERNLRVLERRPREVPFPLPPLIGTGNICSGRLILEYARLGCESVQLHTFFQLPLSEYPATDGSRSQRALHALVFHPRDGLIAGMLDLESQGLLRATGRGAAISRPDKLRPRLLEARGSQSKGPLISCRSSASSCMS